MFLYEFPYKEWSRSVFHNLLRQTDKETEALT